LAVKPLENITDDGYRIFRRYDSVPKTTYLEIAESLLGHQKKYPDSFKQTTERGVVVLRYEAGSGEEDFGRVCLSVSTYNNCRRELFRELEEKLGVLQEI
jgi:hypothetical protein